MTSRLVLLLIILFASIAAAAQAVNSAQETAAVTAADQLFMQGKIADAANRYRAIAGADPSSVDAQVGLLRSYLILGKLDDAKAAADTALMVLPNSWLLQSTVGDLQFRLGKIPEAERSYFRAKELKPDEAAPYLGLARIYRAYSLYRRAYDNMNKAHDIAPNDFAVQLLWINSLPHEERVPALQNYINGSKAKGFQVAKQLEQYLAYLKKNADAPVHACKLASNVKETNTKLYPIPRSGTQLGASGLSVKVNKQELHLALDTGASGVLLGRTAAEQAGLQRLAYQPIAGMGDTGATGGYTAVADRIRVGDLEFQDCVVRVTDAATPVPGQDGLIGSDVFSSYLIDLDIPGAKLRLSPLPKRPDETAAPTSLRTESQDTQELEPEATAESSAAAGKNAAANLPKDAYVAPEMANWAKVYRFRSVLLMPTKVDHSAPMLFLIDTGSYNNVLSTRAAREVTQLRADPSHRIQGLSGSVSKVYSADKATLEFGIGSNGVGRYQQQNQDVTTFDLSNISNHTGTEVSGILGYSMLRILQVKIDYRDGLVDFNFDPNRLPKQIKLK